jgi:hypothetical protein
VVEERRKQRQTGSAGQTGYGRELAPAKSSRSSIRVEHVMATVIAWVAFTIGFIGFLVALATYSALESLEKRVKELEAKGAG